MNKQADLIERAHLEHVETEESATSESLLYMNK